MSGDFENKLVLITGGTAGMGEAAAMAFVNRQAKVIICGRDNVRGHSAVEKIENACQIDGNCEYFAADISDPDQIGTLFDYIKTKYGKLDCAFNAAGAEAVVSPIVQQTLDNFDALVSVDLRGTWLCMKFEIELMLENGGGSIVNCSSNAGISGAPASSIYCACKHGIIGMTKSVALEYVENNIRVNSVCPGIIQTPGLDTVFSKIPGFELDQAKAWGTNLVPMKRLGQPEDVAEAVIWLSSDSASYITGHSLIVDGGIHCH